MLIYWSYVSGLAYFMGKVAYLSTVRACAAAILLSEDEHMKVELANMYVLLIIN
jgi:hypothetical protein